MKLMYQPCGIESHLDPITAAFFWRSKAHTLLKVDIDIVHPASGELSEAKEDINDGGYVSIKREDDVAPVTQLIVLLAAPIDWQFNLGIEIDDPLNPTVAFSGMHDGFPAYEVYLNANHPVFPVTEVLKWKPPLDRGVGFLVGGAIQSAGPGIRINIEQ